MIATTIISSIRVKPCWFFMVYPLGLVGVIHVPRHPAVTVLRQPDGFGTCERYNAGCVPIQDRRSRMWILKWMSRFMRYCLTRNVTLGVTNAT